MIENEKGSDIVREEKQTKNIITKESIYKELRFLNGADIRSACVVLAVMLIIFIPLSIMPIYIFCSIGQKTFLVGLLCFACTLIFLIPIGYWVYSLIKAIAQSKIIKNRAFSIVIDEVSYKQEELEHRHMIKVLYFRQYGRVVSGNTEYQLASGDDAFYLVIYHTKKPMVALHYSMKMYQLEDDIG